MKCVHSLIHTGFVSPGKIRSCLEWWVLFWVEGGPLEISFTGSWFLLHLVGVLFILTSWKSDAVVESPEEGWNAVFTTISKFFLWSYFTSSWPLNYWLCWPTQLKHYLYANLSSLVEIIYFSFQDKHLCNHFVFRKYNGFNTKY